MKKYKGATSALISIEATEKEDTISMKVEWFPDLDLENEGENHPAVFQATMNALKSLKKEESKRGLK